jgi:hypothetical protein
MHFSQCAHFHEPAGFSESNDPATWDAASYSAHPVDSLEPLPDAPNDYRQAAIFHLRLMYVVDGFITAAPDARVAVVAVATVLGWPSARRLERRRHRRPTRVFAVDVDPFDCPI